MLLNLLLHVLLLGVPLSEKELRSIYRMNVLDMRMNEPAAANFMTGSDPAEFSAPAAVDAPKSPHLGQHAPTTHTVPTIAAVPTLPRFGMHLGLHAHTSPIVPTVAAVPAKPHLGVHAPTSTPTAAKPPLEGTQPRAQVLVIVSDHGSGTTDFGEALNTHPCVNDLQEIFAYANVVWSKSEIPSCDGSKFPEAMFDADTGTPMWKNNSQLTREIQALVNKKPKGMGPTALTGESPELYVGLKYDIAQYFVRIRDLVCEHVPANVCPPSDCTITLKMFPQFVNALTGPRLTKDVKPSKCANARNEKAMLAWTDALASFRKNPKIATFGITRNELDRQFSAFHRFSPLTSEFDCSIPRLPYAFSEVNMLSTYTDAQTRIEDCWAGARGAAKCLADALKLVGLTPEPMGDAGTTHMSVSNLDDEVADGQKKDERQNSVSKRSCSTDPDAIFIPLPNGDVEIKI
jgi:hypothetical protein